MGDAQFVKAFQQLPVLHVRGTHRQVGISIGRTFKTFIHDVLESYDFLERLLIPIYNTDYGRNLYNCTYQLCQTKFPKYVEELEGIALGSNVEFYKLFLLHIESVVIPPQESKHFDEKSETGCTCVLSYPDKDTILFGHTEDARRSLQNNVFILDAEILDESGDKLEKFTTLCYSCVLPGYTMGYNEHGLFHSMNSLVPVNICPDNTPVAFLMRAMLGAVSLEHAQEILKDVGTGTSDGFSMNFVYYQEHAPPVLQNIEVAPNPHQLESRIDAHSLKLGESYAHCNKYIRMNVEQDDHRLTSSNNRMETISKYPKPFDLQMVKAILGDRTNPEYPIFRGTSDQDHGKAATVVAGIFDISNKKWLLYGGPPNLCEPIAVLPIVLA